MTNIPHCIQRDIVDNDMFLVVCMEVNNSDSFVITRGSIGGSLICSVDILVYNELLNMIFEVRQT